MARRAGQIVALIALAAGLPGCWAWQQQVGLAREQTANADYAEHRAQIIRMYRDCLKRSETEPTLDCSQYRTAIEVREKVVEP